MIPAWIMTLEPEWTSPVGRIRPIQDISWFPSTGGMVRSCAFRIRSFDYAGTEGSTKELLHGCTNSLGLQQRGLAVQVHLSPKGVRIYRHLVA